MPQTQKEVDIAYVLTALMVLRALALNPRGWTEAQRREHDRLMDEAFYLRGVLLGAQKEG
jgi:hypothetical protein